jgi:ABC-type transporter Mla subunit MlaD
MYVDIVDRGHPTAGKLADGDTVSAQQSQVPVDISNVLDVFSSGTRGRMKAALDSLGVGLPHHGADLRAAFAALGPFVRVAQHLLIETATRTTQTRRLVHNLSLITQELGNRDLELTSLVSNSNSTFAALASNSTSLSSLIEELPPTLVQLKSTFTTLRGTLDQVDPALITLLNPAAQLRRGLESLKSFSIQARPALVDLERPVHRLLPLARALPATSASLAGAFSTLRPQAPRLDRITARIVPCETSFADFFQWTPSVFKFSNGATGAYPRGLTIGAANASLTRSPSCADQAVQP